MSRSGPGGHGKGARGRPPPGRPAACPDRFWAGSHNTAAPGWDIRDIGCTRRKRGQGCRRRSGGQTSPLLRVGTWEGSVLVQSCRHREPRERPRCGLIHAVRDLSEETGGPDRDRRSVHRCGPVGDVRPGGRPGPTRWVRPRAAPYLDLSVLEDGTARNEGPTPPGSAGGFRGRGPGVRRAVREGGASRFVGPGPDAMRKSLGDKIGAKLIAEEAGVPVAPWSRGEGREAWDDALRAK